MVSMLQLTIFVTWDLYSFIMVLHSETVGVPNPKKCQFLHDVAINANITEFFVSFGFNQSCPGDT